MQHRRSVLTILGTASVLLSLGVGVAYQPIVLAWPFVHQSMIGFSTFIFSFSMLLLLLAKLNKKSAEETQLTGCAMLGIICSISIFCTTIFMGYLAQQQSQVSYQRNIEGTRFINY